MSLLIALVTYAYFWFSVTTIQHVSVRVLRTLPLTGVRVASFSMVKDEAAPCPST